MKALKTWNVDCSIRWVYVKQKKKNVYKWYRGLFKKDQEDINDEAHTQRYSRLKTDENVEEVKKIIMADRRITIRKVAEHITITVSSFGLSAWSNMMKKTPGFIEKQFMTFA